MDTIKKLLALLPFQLQVSFALYCANDVKIYLDKKDTESPKALELVAKWLIDNNSVTNHELYDAANAAAYAAANAANAAAHAANAAHHAAAYAAYAADTADTAAADAGEKKKEDKLTEYETHLRKMIKDLTKLEKVIYNINEKEII